MNFKLSQMPDRLAKPRQHGITMVMDKGLSIEEAKNFLSVAHPHVDIVKLGFGTSFVTPNLREKIEVYQSYGLPVYFGGTLFEAFLIRNQFDDYIAILRDYGIQYIEVSDGSITIPHAEKCGYIEKLTRHAVVLSEVGSKDAAHIIPPYKWIELMSAELSAGASYVIAEAQGSGKCGHLPGQRGGAGRPGAGDPDADPGGEDPLGGAAEGAAVVFYRIDWLQCQPGEYRPYGGDRDGSDAGRVARRYLPSVPGQVKPGGAIQL